MSLEKYLRSTDVIDWKTPEVLALAEQISAGQKDQTVIARSAFEWVRDNIQHCSDFDRDEITCSASEALTVGTGFCYAKSHLLAALLRANEIPSGFCYQRLSVDGDGAPFCVHGLNAVYLQAFGWYRMDARGNSKTVNATFTPPVEQLAFSTSLEGEADLPEIHADPLPLVLNALRQATSARDLLRSLPDVEFAG